MTVLAVVTVAYAAGYASLRIAWRIRPSRLFLVDIMSRDHEREANLAEWS